MSDSMLEDNKCYWKKENRIKLLEDCMVAESVCSNINMVKVDLI